MQISICITNYKTDNLISLNKNWIQSLNKNIELEFIIGCNTPYKDLDIATILVDSVPDEDCLMNSKNTQDISLWGKKKSGNQHSVSMQKCFRRASFRYLLSLDPDFFCLIPLSRLVEEIEKRDLAVIGSPHGYVQEFCKHFDFHRSPIGFLPGPFCTLIDRERYTESIIFDPRQSDDRFNSWGDKVDTSLPFRESLYKYKYETFNVCINNSCSICRELGDQYMEDQHGKFRGGCERYFFDNKLCGIHYHYRDGDVSKIRRLLDMHSSQSVYHPLSNFVK